MQVAFYGSTPNYAFIFEQVGHPGTTAALRERQKAGDIAGMAAVIGDELLEHFVVEGTWSDHRRRHRRALRRHRDARRQLLRRRRLGRRARPAPPLAGHHPGPGLDLTGSPGVLGAPCSTSCTQRNFSTASALGAKGYGSAVPIERASSLRSTVTWVHCS